MWLLAISIPPNQVGPTQPDKVPASVTGVIQPELKWSTTYSVTGAHRSLISSFKVGFTPNVGLELMALRSRIASSTNWDSQERSPFPIKLKPERPYTVPLVNRLQRRQWHLLWFPERKVRTQKHTAHVSEWSRSKWHLQNLRIWEF